LAQKLPEKIYSYQNLLNDWYAGQNEYYLKRLKNYPQRVLP
jgi:hypothetical protein